jgi:hypothetical protein
LAPTAGREGLRLARIGSYAVEALVVSDYAAVQGFVLAMRSSSSSSTW